MIKKKRIGYDKDLQINYEANKIKTDLLNRAHEEKERRTKELTNKYFWEQKFSEIKTFSFYLLICALFFVLFFSVAVRYPCLFISLRAEVLASSAQAETSIVTDCNPDISAIFSCCFILSILFTGFVTLLKWTINEWIKDNRERARGRAETEMNTDVDYSRYTLKSLAIL